jgi:hypothetical protein
LFAVDKKSTSFKAVLWSQSWSRKSSLQFRLRYDGSDSDHFAQPVRAIGEVEFLIFWIFNFLQFAIDGKNNSKTKVQKVFFFIFMSSYAEMSFLK